MNRIINLIALLLVLLLILSLLCGCSADAGQVGTTDAGQTGMNPQTPVPTIESTEGEVQTETEPVTEEILPFVFELSSPTDFWYMQDIARNDSASRLSFLHTFGLTDVIGDEHAEQEAVDTWFRDMGTLSVPQISGTPTASYDADTKSLTFHYLHNDQTPIATLTHFLDRNAADVIAEMAQSEDVQLFSGNGSADAIYLHKEPAEGALTATVIYQEQVMELQRYGDDRELLTAMLSDTGFFFTLDSWSIADYNGIPYTLQFSYPDDLETVLSLPQMTDAELEMFSQTDSRFMNGLHTREDAAHVTDLVSRVAFPQLGIIAPETFTVYPEPDRASVLIPLTLDGTRAAQVSFYFNSENGAVRQLYLSRLRDGTWVSDNVTAWMQIGEQQYCAEVYGVYVTLIIHEDENGVPYIASEDVTFEQTAA